MENVKAKFYVPNKKYKGESSIVSVRLSNDLISEYEAIAQKTGRTRSEVLTMALEFAIKNVEIK